MGDALTAIITICEAIFGDLLSHVGGPVVQLLVKLYRLATIGLTIYRTIRSLTPEQIKNNGISNLLLELIGTPLVEEIFKMSWFKAFENLCVWKPSYWFLSSIFGVLEFILNFGLSGDYLADYCVSPFMAAPSKICAMIMHCTNGIQTDNFVDNTIRHMHYNVGTTTKVKLERCSLLTLAGEGYAKLFHHVITDDIECGGTPRPNMSATKAANERSQPKNYSNVKKVEDMFCAFLD